jgi:single-stranded DNA-binding protein
MDLNLAVFCGRLATDPELRTFESGISVMRYLVTVRSESPRRRVDVVPVTLWEPDPDLVADPGRSGDRVWLVGSVQRRFWQAKDTRRSRLEIVAHGVTFVDDTDDTESASRKTSSRVG